LPGVSAIPGFRLCGIEKDEVPLREGGACCNVCDEADWIGDSSYRLLSSFRRARFELKGNPLIGSPTPQGVWQA